MIYTNCPCERCGRYSGRTDFDRLCMECWTEKDLEATAERPVVTPDPGEYL